MNIFGKKHILMNKAGDEAAVGGPGDTNTPTPTPAPAPTPSPAPAMTKMTIGGKEVELPADVAEGLGTFMSDVRAEVEAIKRGQAAAPAPTPTGGDEEEDDIEVLLFTDPKKALALLRAQILSEVKAEANAAKSQKEYWDVFYETHKDLKGMDMLVESVLAKNFKRLENMPALDSMGEIAKLTREAAIKLGVKFQKKDDENGEEQGSNRTTVEGSSAPSTKKTSQEEKTKVTSLSDAVRQRQLSKRTAVS